MEKKIEWWKHLAHIRSMPKYVQEKNGDETIIHEVAEHFTHYGECCRTTTARIIHYIYLEPVSKDVFQLLN